MKAVGTVESMVYRSLATYANQCFDRDQVVAGSREVVKVRYVPLSSGLTVAKLPISNPSTSDP